MTSRAAFRGTASAAALLIDVPTIGTAEARRRVLSAWQPDSSLRALPGGSWLLTLPEPVSLRTEKAPGLPLVLSGGGLAAPGLIGTPDTVTVLAGGEVAGIPLAAAEPVDTSGWVDLSGLTVHKLTPLDRPPEVAEIPTSAVVAQPDLRAVAGIAPPSERSAAFRRSLARAPRRPLLGLSWPQWLVGLLFVVLLVCLILLVVIASREGGPHPFTVLQAVILVIALIRGSRAVTAELTGRATSSMPQKPSRMRKLWSRIVLRSPAGILLRGRQQRYLERLTRQFERRQFDAALRDAIGLGDGSGSGVLSLRLPKPRTHVSPSLTMEGPGTSTFLGETVYQHLQHLYRSAADDLAKAGRIDEAAFVYADLLHDVRAAVDLLERRGRGRLAAELAEGRGLEPALVVRLWWRAGDRIRALEVARSRGAFAAGIERLAAVDQASARDLRIAWVVSCREAGDPVAAVEAGWSDESLRAFVQSDIVAGIAMGGPHAAYLFAHLITEWPTAENLQQALALLESDDLEGRRRFIAALVTLRSTDPAHDRQLSTAALRSLVRAGSGPGEPAAAVRRTITVLRDRCDPLVRADLPRPRLTAASDEPVRFAMADEPGALPVYDAAALRGGAVLVAHGDHGVRLLTMDGRVRARWDLPVHALVIADHGGSALLITGSRSLRTIRRLDLSDRRVRPWTTLPDWRILPSFDGSVLTVVDDDGIAFLDTLSDRPKVLWRELEKDHSVWAINRSPGSLTALVSVKPGPLARQWRLDLLSWELPMLALRLRRMIPTDAADGHNAVLPGQLVVSDQQQGAVTRYAQRQEPDKRGFGVPISSGDALGLVTPDCSMDVQVGDRLVARVACPDQPQPQLRLHDGLVTVWTQDGRIAVIDSGSSRVLANFRTRL